MTNQELKRCPSCEKEWPLNCEQSISIELYQECVGCHFTPMGKGSNSGTAEELEKIQIERGSRTINSELERCAIYRRNKDRCVIECRLGLWSVEGPYGLELINEAMHYFKQYKADGEYNELLGVQCDDPTTRPCC